MAPPNPKRPGRPPQGPKSNKGTGDSQKDPHKDPRDSHRKKTELELPFDDVQPLRADDPSPQRVPQFPSGGRRAVQILRDNGDEDDETTSAMPRPGRYRTPVEPMDEALPSSYATAEMAEPGFSPASVYVERGPGMGQLAPVKQGQLLIGRASSAPLRLQHPSISRRHAQITRRGERFFIKDLGSQNGTYVNQIKIEREVEIFAGDELVVGTSQLRLRGPAGADASVTRSRPDLGANKSFFNAHVTGIAIASCAVGIGLASVIIFAFFKFSRGPSYEQVAVQQPASAQLAPPPPVAPSSVPAAVNAAATRVPAEAAEPDPEPAKAAPPREPEQSRPASTPKKSTRVAAAPKQEEKKQDEPAEALKIDPAIMARYETGNVAAAIELARKKGADAAVARLTRFQSTYEAGQKALAAQDEGGALKNLDSALKQDEALNGGWGKYNADLRKQLSAVYLMAGTRQAKAGDAVAAKRSFSQALKFDPENAAAKSELGKLGAGKANAIDAAFGE